MVPLGTDRRSGVLSSADTRSAETSSGPEYKSKPGPLIQAAREDLVRQSERIAATTRLIGDALDRLFGPRPKGPSAEEQAPLPPGVIGDFVADLRRLAAIADALEAEAMRLEAFV